MSLDWLFNGLSRHSALTTAECWMLIFGCLLSLRPPNALANNLADDSKRRIPRQSRDSDDLTPCTEGMPPLAVPASLCVHSHLFAVRSFSLRKILIFIPKTDRFLAFLDHLKLSHLKAPQLPRSLKPPQHRGGGLHGLLDLRV